RRYRFAGDLLRARILRRNRRSARDPRLRIVGGHELGDSKVEQLGLAVRSHEDVRGFQVAMNHQVVMREAYSIAYLEKQTNACIGVETGAAAPAVNPFSVDSLEHQKRAAVRLRSAVEQPGDILVLKL